MKKLLSAMITFAALASAQAPPANPLVAVSKNIYGIAKNDILGSAEKIPDDLWSFQPTKDVRTIGQLFAHVADAQYEFCGVAVEGKSVAKDLPPVGPVVERVIREVTREDSDIELDHKDVQIAVRDAVRDAVKDAVQGVMKEATGKGPPGK